MAPPRMPIGTRLVLTIYNAKFTFLNKKRGGGGRYTVVLILCDEKFLFQVMKLDDETYGNYEGPITACPTSSITLKDV